MLLTDWLKQTRRAWSSYGSKRPTARRRRVGSMRDAQYTAGNFRLGHNPERLEDRTLLSAAGGIDPADNMEPTADAGGPYSVNEGGNVTLDGSGSFDSDGSISAYHWDFDEDGVFAETGINASRGDEVGVNPVLVATEGSGGATWNVSLRVVDNEGAVSLTDDTQVTVNEVDEFPDAPHFTSPANQTDDTTPTFEWSSVVGAAEYELLVYDIAAGQAVIDQDGIGGTSFTAATELSGGRDYQAFVRAVNGSGEPGDYSQPHEFEITGESLTAPSLYSPASSTSDTTPTYAWTSVSGAASYELVVYDVAAGQEVTAQAGITATSYTPATTLSHGGHYQAFVRAVDSNGSPGPYSSPHEFTVDTSAPPAAPTMHSPPSTTSDTTPVFGWSSVSGAVEYELLVYDYTTGQVVIAQGNIAATAYEPSSPMLAGRSYQAFVRGVDASGRVGHFSSAHHFAIQNTASLGSPTITGPSDPTNDATPTFSWTSVTNASGYELLVYDIAAGQAVIDVVVGGTSFTPDTAMRIDTRYQAFVRGVASDGAVGPWSAAYEFTVTSAFDAFSASLATSGGSDLSLLDAAFSDEDEFFSWQTV